MDFNGMKRKQLQALCKRHKIPANISNLEMVNLLSQLFKDEQKTILIGNIESHDENVSKIESTDLVVGKKVRFSPENELIEYTRPLQLKRRSRRTSVLSRDGTGLSDENVCRYGAENKIGCYERQIISSKAFEGGISDETRGRGGAQILATVEDIDERISKEMKTRPKRNALVDDVGKARKGDSKKVKSDAGRGKNAVDDSIKDETLVAEADEKSGRLTRFRGKKFDETYVMRENGKGRVVDHKGNDTSVAGRNDEKKAVNRRSLRNRYVVSEAEPARDFEEGSKNNGEGGVKILKEKPVKVNVIGEPHVAPRRSRRLASKHDGLDAFDDGVKKLENRGNRGLIKARNRIVLDCSKVTERNENMQPCAVLQLKTGGGVSECKETVPWPAGAMTRSRHAALSQVSSNQDTVICAAEQSDAEDISKPCSPAKKSPEVKRQIRRSKRKLSKCKVNEIVQELDVDPVTQPANKKTKRKMRNVSVENAAQRNTDLSSGKPSKQLATVREKTALLHDDLLVSREASLHEKSPLSALKPAQKPSRPGFSSDMNAKNDITEYHGKEEVASDVSVNADELKTDNMNGEEEKEFSRISDVQKVPLSELNVQESMEQIVSDRDQNKLEHLVLRQLENSTCNSLMNEIGPSGSLHVSLNSDFTDSSSSAGSRMLDELQDFEVNAETAVAEAVKCVQPSLQVIDHVRELEGFFVQQDQEFVEIGHSKETSISIPCHHNDLDQMQASAKLSADTARTSASGEACGLEPCENFYHSVGSNSVLQAKNSATGESRKSSDGDIRVAERYENDYSKGINSEAKTDDGRSKKNHNVASDKDSEFSVADLFDDDQTSTGIISQKKGDSADECSFVDLVVDNIIDQDTRFGFGKIGGLSHEDQNGGHYGDRACCISDLHNDEIQTQTSGSEADKIVDEGKTYDQMRDETEESDDIESGNLNDDQIRTDVACEYSISNLFDVGERTETSPDVKIYSSEVSLKNSDVPRSFSAEYNFRTVRSSSREKVNLETSNTLKSQEAVVGGIIQVKEMDIQNEVSGFEISTEKTFSVEEDETLDQADVSSQNDIAGAVVGIIQVKEVQIQIYANGDEVSKNDTVSNEIIETSRQVVFDTKEPENNESGDGIIEGETVSVEETETLNQDNVCTQNDTNEPENNESGDEIIEGETVAVEETETLNQANVCTQNDTNELENYESGDEIIEGRTVSVEESGTLNQANVCTPNDTNEPEARLMSPLSTHINMPNTLQMEETGFSGILSAQNSMTVIRIRTNGNAGSNEVVEGSISYEDANNVKTSNENKEFVPDSLRDTVDEQTLEATIHEVYAIGEDEMEDKNFGEASCEEVKETGTKRDGNGVAGNRVTDSDKIEESTDMEPSQDCTESELCGFLGTTVDCVAHTESKDACSQGTEATDTTISTTARKSTPNFCSSFDNVEIGGESGSDYLVSYINAALSDETNQVSDNGWDEDSEGNQLKLLYSTPMKSMASNEVDKNSVCDSKMETTECRSPLKEFIEAKSDENLGDATTHASNKVKSLGLVNPCTDSIISEASGKKLTEITHKSPIQTLKVEEITEEDSVSHEDLSPHVEANQDKSDLKNSEIIEISCTKLAITTDCHQTSNLPNETLPCIACKEDANISSEITNDDIEGSLDPKITNVGSFYGRNNASDKDNSPTSSGEIADVMHSISESAASEIHSLGFQSTCNDMIGEEATMETMDNTMPTSENTFPAYVAESDALSSLAIHLLSDENENHRMEKLESKVDTFADEHHESGEEAISSPGVSMPELHLVENAFNSQDKTASVLNMSTAECAEVLKETDVADTIKEYIDCETSVSVEVLNHIDKRKTDAKARSVGEAEEDIDVKFNSFECTEDESIEIQVKEVEETIPAMVSELGLNKVMKSPTCVHSLIKEGSDVKDRETSKKDTKPEELIKPSSRHLCWNSKNNTRTILIHGTPSKVIDMKENPLNTKSTQIGDLTAIRPAKRKALQDIPWK